MTIPRIHNAALPEISLFSDQYYVGLKDYCFGPERYEKCCYLDNRVLSPKELFLFVSRLCFVNSVFETDAEELLNSPESFDEHDGRAIFFYQFDSSEESEEACIETLCECMEYALVNRESHHVTSIGI